MAEKILIIDDEPEMLQVLNRLLTRKGYEVHGAESGEDGLRAIEETMFDLIISDLAMEDLSGLELLEIVRKTDATIPFIMITGVGTIESAVQAIKLGAFHYITKPFKTQEIEILAQRALEYGKFNRQLNSLQVREEEEVQPTMLVGVSKAMQDLMRRVYKVSDSMATILIEGETGTGKTLLAQKIHQSSSRKDHPFMTIDCAALTETLLESELFGHAKGAFTGAIRAKRGLLEEGHGGTVFLDEICEMSPPTQVTLLRAIQEGEIKPVGSNKTVSIDVRFISATSRDIQKEVEHGLFREELYYRLAVVPLHLPPLRDRKEDIPFLIEYYLNKFCKLYKKNISLIKPEVLDLLLNSTWKGNIRELTNLLERGVLLADNDTITMDCILQQNEKVKILERDFEKAEALPLKQVVEEAEKKAIIKALNTTNNNRSETARLLGISRRALYDKIASYNL
jgi:DNA-binding NtrC family response regulator